jgi:hypothetical protein
MPTFLTKLPLIGQPFEGGYYGGLICIYVETFAVIWAPKEHGSLLGAWNDQATHTDATSCCDSMANTIAMAAAGSALAEQALSLEINGHHDWCIPARDVLELGYRHLKPTTHTTACTFRDGDNPSSLPAGYPYTDSLQQTTVEHFRADGSQAFDPAWHWSSSQYSADYAWYQGFGNGFQDSSGKKCQARARAVRMVQVSS